jgi:hypothetical protein
VSGPPGLADSSGVTPNLTFEVDGLDYYTTGNIRYTGQWIKKGFTFRTGPTQTSFVLKFFNNAPGGGGNDWALDDISVATCMPNLTVNPTPFYTACAGNVVDFGATVRSFFNNYNQYKWQRSTNNGASWSDLGVSGTGVPVLVGGQYEYSVAYPTFIATSADSGHRYRIVVATTIPNLSNTNCSSASSADFTTLNIINCTVLPVQLITWTGTAVKNQAKLRWVTEKEDGPVNYTIEKSENGTNYLPAGNVEGKYLEGAENAYQFDDPVELRQPTFYRLTISSHDGRPSYSQVILLKPYANDYDAEVMQNPFKDIIRINLHVPEKGEVLMRLMDMSGRILQFREATMEKGVQVVEWKGFERYANGLYMLEVSYRNQRQIIRLMKEK